MFSTTKTQVEHMKLAERCRMFSRPKESLFAFEA
jgi:hypothetical protein